MRNNVSKFLPGKNPARGTVYGTFLEKFLNAIVLSQQAEIKIFHPRDELRS